MQLIGMLDSPYVRRAAVSMQLLGLRFEHRSVSVFRGFDEFQRINPIVKAPSLVCDDGQVLMDSTLIIDYAQGLATNGRLLVPSEPADRLRTLRLVGLALAACEKSVQIVYERNLRPAEKLHQPWLSRVSGQLLAACGALEAELHRRPLPITSAQIDQAGITTAVVWRFVQAMVPEVVLAADHPALQACSDQAERLREFVAAPHGEGSYVAG